MLKKDPAISEQFQDLGRSSGPLLMWGNLAKNGKLACEHLCIYVSMLLIVDMI